MPLIRIETNCEASQQTIDEIMTRVIDRVNQDNGNLKSMISVVVNTEVNVSFGCDLEKPAAAVQFFIGQIPPENTSKITASISAILFDRLRIPAEQMYVFFHLFPELYLVGWNGTTFDKINPEDIDPNCKN